MNIVSLHLPALLPVSVVGSKVNFTLCFLRRDPL